MGMIVNVLIARLAHERKPPTPHHVEWCYVGCDDRQPEHPLGKRQRVLKDRSLRIECAVRISRMFIASVTAVRFVGLTMLVFGFAERRQDDALFIRICG